MVYSTPGGPATAQDNGSTTGDPGQSPDAVDLEEPGQSGSPGQFERPGPEGAGSQGTSTRDEPAIVMEEVVVTARKRAQPAFEVPLSRSTIQETKSTALGASRIGL